MANFTPGPWEKQASTATYVPDAEGCKFEIRESEGLVLAAVISDCVPEHEANANLMAAAPEMYEALVASVKISEGLYEALRQMGGCIMPTVESVNDMSRVALAKADGKAAR